ncbi:hypothetical protein E2636_13530 [Paenisporosarcina antarctica]|uniref:Uncharacterized protein n=1 Tax=Paenisporosarcina antarctica TaxID=417367 RepID=A0A4P7A2I5_9BACL|nr:hypothetical protein E2636_13530 [Paenisporosarcina antarctica]
MLVDWSARWRLQREKRELKIPQERVFRDEEAEAVPAESVHLERKATGYLTNRKKRLSLLE